MEMLKESDLKILFSETEIQKEISKLGQLLNEKYMNEELYMCSKRFSNVYG